MVLDLNLNRKKSPNATDASISGFAVCDNGEIAVCNGDFPRVRTFGGEFHCKFCLYQICSYWNLKKRKCSLSTFFARTKFVERRLLHRSCKFFWNLPLKQIMVTLKRADVLPGDSLFFLFSFSSQHASEHKFPQISEQCAGNQRTFQAYTPLTIRSTLVLYGTQE